MYNWYKKHLIISMLFFIRISWQEIVNYKTINLPLCMKSFLIENFTRNKAKHTGNTKRVEFIDLAKGICILLVVLCHMPNLLNTDMPGRVALTNPFYFFLSGMFFKDYGGFGYLVEKKINKILIPYIFFLVVGIVINSITFGILPSFIDFFSPIFSNVQINGPIWFLCSLFIVNILFCLIKLFAKNRYLIAICVLICSCIGYFLSMQHVYLPYYGTQAFNGLPLFYIGYIVRHTPLLYRSKYDYLCFPLALVFLGLAMYYSVLLGGTPHVNFWGNTFQGNVINIYGVTLTMIFGMLFLCKSIQWIPVVSYLGRYSIITLGMHMVYCFYLNVILTKNGYSELTGFPCFIYSVFMCWISIPFLIKYVPWFTAQKDLIRLPNCLMKILNYVSSEKSHR